MWSEEKQQRLDVLRRREAEGLLSDAERCNLAAMLAELDAEEWEALGPALAEMQRQEDELAAEREHLEARAVELQRVVSQQEDLAADARRYLADLRARRAALAAEYRRVAGRKLAVPG